MIILTDNDFELLTSYIKSNFGINLTQKRSLIECRLSSTIIQLGFDNFKDYLNFAFEDKSGEQITNLINRLTTNHTFFMREFSHFEFCKNNVFPDLKKRLKDKDLRVWSAGCSTGEEPYTLAMIIDEVLGAEKQLWDSKILATDISQRALTDAKFGVYSKEAVKQVPPNWLLNYFKPIGEDDYEIKEKIKNQVVFRSFNLMQDEFPFKKKFHVIYCRNVMIYFDQQDKIKLINKFYEHTEEGGYLFIGHSESINRNETQYKYIMPSIYRKG